MKILIIKPSSLGDVVQSLPVLCNLRRHYPEAQIDWLVFSPYGELLEGHPDIDHVLSIQKPKLSWSLIKADLLPLRQWFQETRYDLSIDLQGLLRSGIMTVMAGAKRKIGLASAREGASFFYDETVQDTSTHAAARYLQVLDYLKIPYDPHLFRLETLSTLPVELQEKSSYVVFHPYTRWKTKLWPWRNYQKIAQKIAPEPCVLIGNGPWFPCEGENIIDLRGRLDLKKTMKVLQGARTVLSTDSGPGHLSAALGTETISLFGATDLQKTAPVGIKTATLFSAISCSPCLKRTCKNRIPMLCMKEISVFNVLTKIQENIS